MDSFSDQLERLFPNHEVIEEEFPEPHYLRYTEIELIMQLPMLQGEALWLRLQMMALPLVEDESYYNEVVVEVPFIDIDHPPKVEVSEENPSPEG